MTRIMRLSKFDPSKDFVALRSLSVAHEDPDQRELRAGARIDKTLFTERRLRLLYELRRIGVAGGLPTSQATLPPPLPKVSEESSTPAATFSEEDEEVNIVELEEDPKEILPLRIEKRTGQYYILRGPKILAGPMSQSAADRKKKDMERDQAA